MRDEKHDPDESGNDYPPIIVLDGYARRASNLRVICSVLNGNDLNGVLFKLWDRDPGP